MWTPLECEAMAKARGILSYIRRCVTIRTRGWFFHPAVARPVLSACVELPAPQHKRNMELLEELQPRAK